MHFMTVECSESTKAIPMPARVGEAITRAVAISIGADGEYEQLPERLKKRFLDVGVAAIQAFHLSGEDWAMWSKDAAERIPR